MQSLSQTPLKLHHTEGYPECGWILLDYGEVIFHIFQDDMRERFDLEGLWSEAETVRVGNEGRKSLPRRKVSYEASVT